MRNVIKGFVVMFLLISMLGCGKNQNTGIKESQSLLDESQTVTDIEETTEIKDIASSYTGVITEEIVRTYRSSKETDFRYEKVSGGIRILEYVGSDTLVVIPKTINGDTVVEINGYVFANDSTVRGVFIPETVKVLQETFINNKNVEVIICEGVEYLNKGVFTNCSKLHTVVLGDNLLEIGSSAFGGCISLEKLYIPSSLNKIDGEWSVFSSCTALTIYGESGSLIESFALSHEINFEAQ